jgi:hypothetical protein
LHVNTDAAAPQKQYFKSHILDYEVGTVPLAANANYGENIINKNIAFAIFYRNLFEMPFSIL